MSKITEYLKETKVELNTKVIDFTSMFIEKVLQAEKEVDFETVNDYRRSVRMMSELVA